MECSDDCPRPTLPDEMPVMVLPDCHHFNVLDSLASADGVLTGAVLRLIGR